MSHSWGKHGAKVVAFYTADMLPAEADSGGDVNAARPGGRVKLVVLVVLPFKILPSSIDGDLIFGSPVMIVNHSVVIFQEH